MKNLFFVTPIGHDDSPERKRSDQFMKYLLNPVAQKLGYDVTRVDQMSQVDKIDNTITEHLKTSDLVVIDMSDLNANVFYEFGFRQALELPLIPVIQKDTNIPFDVANLRTIFYDLTDLYSVESVKNKLEETMIAIESDFTKPEVAHESSSIPSTALLSIQDKLDTVITLIQKRNDDEIDLIASQVAKHAHPTVDPETELMRQLMPELIKNPFLMNTINDKLQQEFNK